ncbi:cobalamin biosynthesis protein [Vallitalea okinawensis]|uniref:cobalamin biosynthesis protein n=1 Tax=Vallitalea okinawensis TaxID=2078660 RepID=UPI000CFBC1FB|nr:cobalamin biosynthesis protein [Vallitalea okinawensis]
MSNLLAICIAFIIDACIGDPYWFPHPVKYVGKYIKWFERSFYKKQKNIRYIGLLLTLTTVLLSFGITALLLWISLKIHIAVFWVTNILIMWTCIAHRCLGDEARKVYKKLKEDDLEGARKQVGYLVARETDQLEEVQVCKAVIETVVENTSDGIIAPLFYIAIGGAPLGMAYKTINTLDSMVGYKNERYKEFGYVSAKLDDFANYIPARLTGILMVVASFFLKMDYRQAFKILKRDRRNHASPNAGYPESATAGALGIQLGGDNVYFGKVVSKPTIGDDKQPVVKRHIKDSIYLMTGSTVLFIITLIGLNIALHGIK